MKFGTLGGSRAARDELARAKLVLPHAMKFGTLGGSRAARDELARAKLVLPHAIHRLGRVRRGSGSFVFRTGRE
jgi:hypothetical protein